jgi:hypothetical protein
MLQLHVGSFEFEQLRLCQTTPRADCHAAFTVQGPGIIWPSAVWGDPPGTQRTNVRGWFPLLDKIADESLIWRPQGCCFFVSCDEVRYRIQENDLGVLFLQLTVEAAAEPDLAVAQGA